MQIDLLLESAFVPALHYSVVVVKGQKFTLIADVMPEGAEVYASQGDKVLGIEVVGRNIKVEALEVGVSKIRIMTSQTVTERELSIEVAESVGLPAESINATFGSAVPR